MPCLVTVDSKMSLETQVNSLCGNAFRHLHNIGRIRGYFNRATTERLICAFVTTRLDYCNSLVFGIPNTLVDKLQRVQNAAARVRTGTKYAPQ